MVDEDELIDHIIKRIQESVRIDEINFESAAPGVNLFFGIKNSGQSMLVRKLASKGEKEQS